MHFEVHLAVKSFAAVVAQEGPEVGVSAHVRVEVGRPVECFPADRAHVGLNGGVGEAVAGQIAGLAKGTGADFTLEWLLTCVDTPMRDEGVAPGEGLVAYIALVPLSGRRFAGVTGSPPSQWEAREWVGGLGLGLGLGWHAR